MPPFFGSKIMGDDSTKKIDLKTVALLNQAAYLLTEERDIPVICAIHVPGRKPLVVFQGSLKDLMILAARIDAEFDIVLGKHTLVEIISEAAEEVDDLKLEEISVARLDRCKKG